MRAQGSNHSNIWRKFHRRLRHWAAQQRRRHDQDHHLHTKFQQRMIEMRRRHQAETHQLIAEVHRQQWQWRNKPDSFRWYQHHVRYARPVRLLVNLLIFYLIFRYLGLKTISIAVISLMSIGILMEAVFIRRLERRVLEPINELRAGVEEVARGNYAVSVGLGPLDEMNVLVTSFNTMVQKLHESEKLKVEYEENRRALIANISHDLKTPITTIQGYTETMLERRDLPQDLVDKYHRIVYHNAIYLNKLIDDLFLFSRLDMQKLDFQMEMLDLGAFLDDLVGELQYELEDKKVALHYRNEIGQPCSITLDRKRINQVIRNIVGNAIKYGHRPDLAIEIAVRINAGMACISISDNGPGIPEDKLSHIFERFYRIDDARTKDLMSTGLGLAIAKELVEAHGGQISATHAAGGGTCITVTLPLSEGLSAKLEAQQ